MKVADPRLEAEAGAADINGSPGRPDDATAPRRRTATLTDLERRVVALLRTGPQTSWSAYDALHLTCLRTVIHRLREKGVLVVQDRAHFIGTHGQKVWHCRYWIEGGA
jgi:hypothetical protein